MANPAANLNGKVVELAPYLARPNLADGLNREELAALLEQVKGLEGRVMARLLMGMSEQPTATRPPEEADRMLTTAEAAAMLRRKPSWIYRHAADLPFVVKRESPRSPLLCSEQGVRRYLARR